MVFPTPITIPTLKQHYNAPAVDTRSVLQHCLSMQLFGLSSLLLTLFQVLGNCTQSTPGELCTTLCLLTTFLRFVGSSIDPLVSSYFVEVNSLSGEE